MARRDLIDPDVREPLDQLLQVMPGGFNTIPDIVQRRAAVAQLLAALEIPPNPNVTSEDRAVPGPDGAPDIRVRIYRPADSTGTLPGIYFIHGGGMIMGDIEEEDAVASAVCEHVDAVVVSVEYRLAPEHPYPAPVEDCYAGLVWMARNAAELRFDPDRLAVYGGSAGGGLTIATSMLARDRGGPAIRFQMPIYPMIDDRNENPVEPRDHRHRAVGPRGQHRGLEVVPGRRQARSVRRADPRGGPGRPSADLHRRRHRRPVPGRGHRVRDAAHAGRRPDRAARQSRRLPRGGGVRAGGSAIGADLGAPLRGSAPRPRLTPGRPGPRRRSAGSGRWRPACRPVPAA